MAYKDLCRMNRLPVRGCSMVGAGVSDLVLHREPFFLLTIGLRSLYRLKNRWPGALLTLHPKTIDI